MKRKSKDIADRFREVFLNGTWVANTNYKKVLDDVSWQQATTQVNSLNTVFTLTFHINYYVEGVLNVFEGNELIIKDKYSFNVPEITSNKDWISLKETLLKNAEKFANHIEDMTDEKLESIFVNKKYGSYYRYIEGMIAHSIIII